MTLPGLRAQLGGNDHWFSSHLSKSLFVIGTGGNDYLLNYFLRSGPTQKISLQDFTRTLITDLSKQLMVRDRDIIPLAIVSQVFIVHYLQVHCNLTRKSQVSGPDMCDQVLSCSILDLSDSPDLMIYQFESNHRVMGESKQVLKTML